MYPYSFSNVIMLVDGVEITGWSEGDDVISVKRRVDSATDKVGAGGTMFLSISTDKSGEFEFKLDMTSPSNNYLQSKVDAMELLGANFTPSSVRFQDLARQDLATGSLGYVKKPAEMTRGVKTTDQTWMIVVENLVQAFGPSVLL